MRCRDVSPDVKVDRKSVLSTINLLEKEGSVKQITIQTVNPEKPSESHLIKIPLVTRPEVDETQPEVKIAESLTYRLLMLLIDSLISKQRLMKT